MAQSEARGITTLGVYHLAISVNDLERAIKFYTEVLGMRIDDAHGGIGKDDMGLDVGRAALLCGEDGVVLFQRPKPTHQDALAEFGAMHTALAVAGDTFDYAVKNLELWGARVHELPVMERKSGRSIYFFDSEGNLLQLWTPPAGVAVHRASGSQF